MPEKIHAQILACRKYIYRHKTQTWMQKNISVHKHTCACKAEMPSKSQMCWGKYAHAKGRPDWWPLEYQFGTDDEIVNLKALGAAVAGPLKTGTFT